jgi:hypothetical protein
MMLSEAVVVQVVLLLGCFVMLYLCFTHPAWVHFKVIQYFTLKTNKKFVKKSL